MKNAIKFKNYKQTFRGKILKSVKMTQQKCEKKQEKMSNKNVKMAINPTTKPGVRKEVKKK